MEPMPELNIISPCVHSNTFTMGTHLPESTLSLSHRLFGPLVTNNRLYYSVDLLYLYGLTKSSTGKTMDEGSKGIRHGGGGANLRCPVFTTVHFSLRDEGSSEYIQVCGGRESLRPNF